MQPLYVQQYLKSHTFGELEDEFGVTVSVSSSRPYKFSVNYSQIESRPGPLVNQCRGLVLRIDPWDSDLPTDSKALRKICPGETVVLARPFDRFFNYGDPNAAAIDWNDRTLSVQEKLDGTLAIVYYDDIAESWCMATRSVPDADVPFTSCGQTLTYRELFDRALVRSTGLPSLDELMAHAERDVTHMFELTSPLNRIVVKYPHESLTWLASRRIDGQELSYVAARDTLGDTQGHFPREVVRFPLHTLDDVLGYLRVSDPMALEGVVVAGVHGRVKVKSAAWLAANRVKTSCGNLRALTNLILCEKVDDALEFLDADGRNFVQRVQDGLRDLLSDLNEAHHRFMDESSSQKEYALNVQASGLWPQPLYEMRSKGITARQWLDSKRDKGTGIWPDTFIDRLLEVLHVS